MQGIAERKRPTNTAGAGEHIELMRAIGSRDGYDPIPSSQIRFMQDRRQPAASRLLGWVMVHTIHKGRRRTRTPYAQDDQRGALTLRHAAVDLGFSLSNASSYAKQLEEEGRIKRDEKGRIYLRGDVPAPELTAADEDEDTTPAEAETDDDQVRRLLEQFKVSRGVAEFVAKLPAAKRGQAITRLQTAHNTERTIYAELIAAARDLAQQVHANLYASIGYEAPEERRGRPAKERGKSLLGFDLTPVELYVQKTFAELEANFVENSEALPDKKVFDFLQKTDPYRTEIQRNRVSECDPEAAAEPPEDTHTPTLEPLPSQAEKLQLLETLDFAGYPITAADPLAGQFLQLAQANEISVATLCEAITRKTDQRGDYIQSAGALYKFVAEDLEKLLARKRRNAPGSRLDAGSPVDTSEEAEAARRARLLRELADPNVSEAEKRIIRMSLEPDPRARSAAAGSE